MLHVLREILVSSARGPEPIEDPPPGPRKPRRWLLIGMIVAAPLAVIGMAYVIACWRAHAILEREIALIQQRGEPVWFADLEPAADDESIARGKTIARLVNGFDRVPWEFLDDASKRSLTDELATQVQKVVDGYRPDLQAILDLLRQGECRFDYDFQTREPYNILLAHVQNLRNVQRVLAADCHVALARGERRRAIERLHEMFDLNKTLRRDPFAVSQYVRKALANQALDALQATLGQSAPDEQDVDSLSRQLQKLESDFRLADCMRAERSLMLVSMENLGHPGMAGCLEDNARGISRSKAAVLNYWWGSPLYRPRRLHEEAVMLRTMGRLAELVDLRGASSSEQFAATLDEVGETDFPVFHELVKPWIVDMRERGLIHRQRLVSARWALAVYRYRDRHGQLPESLEELETPPGADAIGLISGKPLVYERTADGFAISGEPADQTRFEVKFVSGVNEH